MSTPLKSTANILRTDKRLQNLLVRTQQLSRLQAILHAYLAPAAQPHCLLANYQDGCLTLTVSDAMWATRLRYQQKKLLGQLSQHAEFNGLQHIQFKVSPNITAVSERQGPRQDISDPAREHIRLSAEAIEDPELKAALERLALRN